MNTEKFAAHIDRASSEFSDFLDDLSGLIDSAAGGDVRAEIEKRIRSARSNLQSAYDDISDAGSALHQRARERVERGIDYSRDRVSDYPLSSVGIAAVGGLIVGLLLAGSRR